MSQLQPVTISTGPLTPEEVIAVANEVTHSVFDDGAAHVLRSLL